MPWRELLHTCWTLALQPNASQSDLRRSASTAYYAMFHALCKMCADCIAGTSPEYRSKHAWRQAYRALEHRFASNQFQNQSVMVKFPPGILYFAEVFSLLQHERHLADYDPIAGFDTELVEELIKIAEKAIEQLENASMKDRHALAVWLLLKHRPYGRS